MYKDLNDILKNDNCKHLSQ